MHMKTTYKRQSHKVIWYFEPGELKRTYRMKMFKVPLQFSQTAFGLIQLNGILRNDGIS